MKAPTPILASDTTTRLTAVITRLGGGKRPAKPKRGDAPPRGKCRGQLDLFDEEETL